MEPSPSVPAHLWEGGLSSSFSTPGEGEVKNPAAENGRYRSGLGSWVSVNRHFVEDGPSQVVLFKGQLDRWERANSTIPQLMPDSKREIDAKFSGAGANLKLGLVKIRTKMAGTRGARMDLEGTRLWRADRLPLLLVHFVCWARHQVPHY